MFTFFKKKHTVKTDLSGLFCDMHSHILPGIDDGSVDVENSLELMEGLIDLGYKKFIATPHILWDMYKNDKHTINEAKLELMASMRQAGMDVSLSAAAEYYLDDHFDDLLDSGDPLLTIKDNWLLVEFSFMSPPLNLKEKLFDLQIRGYQPVLAHPERYLYLAANKKFYDEMKDAGLYFQVNLLSLAGYYGKGPYELGHYLMKRRYIDLLGTDLHHTRHLHALRHSNTLMDHVNELLDSGKILNGELW